MTPQRSQPSSRAATGSGSRATGATPSAAAAKSSDAIEDDAARAEYQLRRLRDIAILIPAIGVFLLLSPVVRLFVQPVELAGAPLIVIYISSVWLALIGAAWGLSRITPPTPDK